MTIDWIQGFAGGLAIGTAAGIYLLAHGRIMGASGIVGALVDRTAGRGAGLFAAFLAGLVALPFLWTRIWPAETHATTSWPVLIAAGLLVGFGTRLANGCTSGHGVCGISRLSRRGIVASLAYVLAGAATMALARHLLGVI